MAKKIALIIVNNEVLMDVVKDEKVATVLTFRKGANKDGQRMRDMFSELGFEIIDKQNLTALQIEEEIKTDCLFVRRFSRIIAGDLPKTVIASSTPCDCFVFVLSTHGGEIPLAKESLSMDVYDGMVMGADGQPVSANRLVNLLNSETLKGKPKLCFIQACRSIENDPEDDKYDLGVEVGIVNPETNNAIVSIHQTDNKSTTDYNPNVSTVATDSDRRNVQGDAVIHEAGEDTIDTQKGATTSAPPNVPIAVAPVDCPRDCLIMYAVQPHMNALRSKVEGSWMFYYMFEQRKVLKNGDRNIFPYLTSVLNKMAQHTCKVRIYKDRPIEKVKMCATIYHRLSGHVYF